jgi:putative hydrolase of the HAD superfamily
MYQHIFWDLDHTLWHFDKNSIAALQLTYNYFKLHELGITNFDEFNVTYHYHNNILWDRFRKGYISREELRWKRMYRALYHFKIFNETLAKQMAEQYLVYLPEQTHLFADTIEILNYCKDKKYTQHIITNGFEATQIQKMNNSNIAHYFTHIITSEKAMSIKPNIAIYTYALALAGATINNSVMIGDAIEIDIKGALDSGMPAIWYNYHKAATSSPFTHQVSTLAELKQYL